MRVPTLHRRRRPQQHLLEEFLFWDYLNNLVLLKLGIDMSLENLQTVTCSEIVSFTTLTGRQAVQQVLGLSPGLPATIHSVAALF